MRGPLFAAFLRLSLLTLFLLIILKDNPSLLGRTPKPDGAMEDDRPPKGYYTTISVSSAQGALGDRDGAITS
jgi:hypothetical protein